LWRRHRAGRDGDASAQLYPLSHKRPDSGGNGDFRDMLLRSPGMAGPAIVHIEFKSSDFARTSAFYAKLFEWRTEQNASGSYLKADGADGPSGGWGRADLVQSPGPIAYLP